MATLVPTTVDYDQLANLRQVLAPQYAILPSYRIRAQMEALYGPEAAEIYEDYLEGLFGSIGNAFSSAARDVGRFAVKAAPVAPVPVFSWTGFYIGIHGGGAWFDNDWNAPASALNLANGGCGLPCPAFS